MRIHFCPLDADCRTHGAPWRVYVFTRRWNWIVALRPSGRAQKRPHDYERFGWVTRTRKDP